MQETLAHVDIAAMSAAPNLQAERACAQQAPATH
jgi:hypothetical protein